MECGVCVKLFTIHGKKPVSLPCGHTLCQQCAQNKAQNEQVVCPYDNKVHPVKPDDLPINQEILENIPETDLAPPHCLDDENVIKENSVNLVLKQEYNLGDFVFGKGPDLGDEELIDVKEAMMDNNVKYRGQMVKNTLIRHGKGK